MIRSKKVTMNHARSDKQSLKKLDARSSVAVAKLCLRNHGFEDERASVQAAISPRARKSRQPAPAAPAAGICWVAVMCDLEDLAKL